MHTLNASSYQHHTKPSRSGGTNTAMNPTRLSKPRAMASALSFLNIFGSSAFNLHLLESEGCTPPIFRILCYLHFHSGSTMTEIARVFKRTPAAIYELTLAAEKHGYMMRTKAAGNKKMKPLILTEKAAKLIDDVTGEIVKFLMPHSP